MPLAISWPNPTPPSMASIRRSRRCWTSCNGPGGSVRSRRPRRYNSASANISRRSSASDSQLDVRSCVRRPAKIQYLPQVVYYKHYVYFGTHHRFSGISRGGAEPLAEDVGELSPLSEPSGGFCG